MQSFPATAETPDIKASAIIQILDQAASASRNIALQFRSLVISLRRLFDPYNCLYIKFSYFFSAPTRHNSFLGNSSLYINFWCHFAAWNSRGSLVHNISVKTISNFNFPHLNQTTSENISSAPLNTLFTFTWLVTIFFFFFYLLCWIPYSYSMHYW